MRSLSLIICAMLILIISSISYAKEWKGIIPLHSTCEDVKRVLGVSKCETSTYYFEHENAFIMFSQNACEETGGNQWDVSPGTVINITVWPKRMINFTELAIDLSKYKKTENAHTDTTQYSDEEEGFSFTVLPGGEVGNFYYGPTALDKSLRCKKASLIFLKHVEDFSAGWN